MSPSAHPKGSLSLRHFDGLPVCATAEQMLSGNEQEWTGECRRRHSGRTQCHSQATTRPLSRNAPSCLAHHWATFSRSLVRQMREGEGAGPEISGQLPQALVQSSVALAVRAAPSALFPLPCRGAHLSSFCVASPTRSRRLPTTLSLATVAFPCACPGSRPCAIGSNAPSSTAWRT